MKEIRKLMELQEGRKLSDDEFSKKLFALMQSMNGMDDDDDLTEENAESVEDFLYLSEMAPIEKEARRLVKKALELEPDNVDAMVALAQLNAHSLNDLEKEYCKIIEIGKKKLEEDGFMNIGSIGDFWFIHETRPFMRLLYEYTELLTSLSKMRLAAKHCEYMLYLCENDNLGARYRLMHIWAYLEEQEKAEKLLNKYEEDSAMFLLPASILYYKLGDETKAKEFLKKLYRSNKDLKAFVQMLADDMSELLDEGDEEMATYRPDTIEELKMAFFNNTFLYADSITYFLWAKKQLKGMK